MVLDKNKKDVGDESSARCTKIVTTVLRILFTLIFVLYIPVLLLSNIEKHTK